MGSNARSSNSSNTTPLAIPAANDADAFTPPSAQVPSPASPFAVQEVV